MPPRQRFLPILAALVVSACVVASAETGYRIKIAPGNSMTASDDWITVDQINRSDPEAICRFQAVQIVVPLNQATQRLDQSSLRNDKIGSLEFDFTRPNRPYVRIEIRGVTVTNVRTLDGPKQRVTMRYESCSVKDKK